MRITDLVGGNLNSHFLGAEDHKTKFNIERFMQQFFDVFSPFFNMLQSSYSKRLWNFVFSEFCDLYIQMIVMMSMKYSAKEKEVLCEKVEMEVEVITDLFSEKVATNILQKNQKKLLHLQEILFGDNDKVITHLTELMVILGEKFNEKSMVLKPPITH